MNKATKQPLFAQQNQISRYFYETPIKKIVLKKIIIDQSR